MTASRFAPFWASVIVLTGLGYWSFPGHSYLESDTQIWVPMMERIYNPVLFSDDHMVSRPYLALTAYDEITVGLREYAGLDFQHGLQIQQVVFRACAAAGLLLIASQFGLGPPAALFVAGVMILNATGPGMGTTDLEPVPRSFALGLLLLGVGLALNRRFLAAGIAGALGFLIHPPTLAPFFLVAAFVVLRRSARPILLAPLLPAAVVLALLMHFQSGTTEPLDLFRRLDPFQEALLRQYMRPRFVSEWNRREVLDCLCECAVVGAALWRLRERLQNGSALRDWLWGFAAVGGLSVPFAWIVLDQAHWALAGPWDPIRALFFIALLASLLSAVCGIIAVQKKIWWEAPMWLAIAFALPVKDRLVTWFVNPWLIALVVALVGVSVAAAWFSGTKPASRTRGLALAIAGVLPFLALPASGLLAPPAPADSPELKQLAEWARAKTDETTVFLFADDGLFGGSGPFRARALRSVYVDYEGRAVASFYPGFAAEWMMRWRDVHQGGWLVGPQDFPDLAERHIDFVVLRKEHAIPTKRPAFSNSRYEVYRVGVGF
jgi:hypothetical protein